MATVSALFLEGLKSQFDGGIQAGDNLEIDLSQIEKVDSSAVSLMLAWLREAERSKVGLCFTHVPDNLASLAKLYGVAELLTLQAA
jgi:phospholipid transport system transporter-binding protein